MITEGNWEEIPIIKVVIHIFLITYFAIGKHTRGNDQKGLNKKHISFKNERYDLETEKVYDNYLE